MASVEFLFLANYAEVRDGLLFTVGAGWSQFYRPTGPEGEVPVSRFGLGASVLVPWDETNQPHPLELWIEHEEDGSVLSRLNIDVMLGRPPNLAAGSDQREVFGLSVELMFPEAGAYRLFASVDENLRSVGFNVYDYPSDG